MTKRPKRMKIRYEYIKSKEGERRLEHFFDFILSKVRDDLVREYKIKYKE